MDVVVASTEADLEAVEAIKAHHAQMAGALTTKVGAVHGAARSGADVSNARHALVTWSQEELLPHAAAEEQGIYAAAGALPEGRLLVEALVAEHQVIIGLVTHLSSTSDALDVAATAASLQTMFQAHLAKENEQVLPLLAATPSVSVAALLEDMHEQLGGHRHADGHAHGHDHGHSHGEPQAEGGCGGGCTCGETDTGDDVELDARAVPHAIRHATIFGALDGLPAGTALVLVAPHDPIPLLAQVEQRDPGAFEVSYLERGPEAWRLRFLRRAA